MGIFRSDAVDVYMTEVEELRCTIASACGVLSPKNEEGRRKEIRISALDIIGEDNKLVCVTSGVSFLGRAIVNSLLTHGYSVRILVDNPEEMERIKEMGTAGAGQLKRNVEAVVAKVVVDSDGIALSQAFEGCRGVFHTSSFTDPAGLSGYSKTMAEIEVMACENVMKACANTPSVRKCVLTSSLLACIWRDNTLHHPSPVINHECWSDESICTNKKLWYALGKLRSEMAAWKIANTYGLKLTTICPGLITGPEFCLKNPTATIAYLKGAQEMYADGTLATVDVNNLAEAHVCVYKLMNKTAFGRYICFDNIMGSEEDVQKLVKEVEIPVIKTRGYEPENISTRFELSNKKLSYLMSRTERCYYED